MPAQPHEHDPTLDARTCRRIARLEEAVLRGNFAPLISDSVSVQDDPRISNLEARLAALEGILTRVAEHFEGGQG